MQGFYPNDRMAYPLYEAINDGGAIALFHTGQTGVGSGMPGGMGMRLKYSNPMYMDDVAADFPDLKIILAHPSFPWQEEALSVATHKPNVYIDLSGWSPKYFPPILVRYINSILQDKMLFGSDWPVITPDRWLADFAKLDIRDEIRPKVLKANARKILGHLARTLGQNLRRRRLRWMKGRALPPLLETDASGEIAEIYADIRRDAWHQRRQPDLATSGDHAGRFALGLVDRAAALSWRRNRACRGGAANAEAAGRAAIFVATP